MTQSKSNGIQENAITVHNFVWTGRNDLEDAHSVLAFITLPSKYKVAI